MSNKRNAMMPTASWCQPVKDLRPENSVWQPVGPVLKGHTPRRECHGDGAPGRSPGTGSFGCARWLCSIEHARRRDYLSFLLNNPRSTPAKCVGIPAFPVF